MKLKITVAQNRFDKNCINTEFTWEDFLSRIRTPIRTTETYEQFMSFPRSKQDNLKDVGGFIAGESKDGKKQATSILNRCMVVLDADNIEHGQTQKIIGLIDGKTYNYAIYSTRKHSSYKPRLRIIIPTNRVMTPDEYEPVARKIAEPFMGILDKSTFEVNRIMYWPSCSKNSEFIFTHNQVQRGLVDVDGVLGLYKNWKDVSEWPKAPNENEIATKDTQGHKLMNPCEKKGIVGAFNTIYDIHSAIAEFLTNVYEPRKSRR